MEGLTELIPFLLKGGDTQMWDDFLRTCKELRVFAKKSSESVSLINSLLNEPDTRLYGLRLLEIFLRQCSSNIISENITHWFHQCLKGLAQPALKNQCPLSCSLICILLEVSTEYPDVIKQTSQVFIPKILDCIQDKLKDSSYNRNPVLLCLFSCLFHYGKSCGSQKDNLEKVLIELLSTEVNTVHNVSKCFHLLAQTGAPGADCMNYKQNWHSQHLIVINSLHAIVDQLFSDANEILGSFNLPSTEKRKLNLPTISDENPLVKSHKLSRLFCGLCEILESMLLNTFPVSKKIHPEAIFGIICRALAVTNKSLEANISNASYALLCYLNEIHISAIKLFNSLIVCSRSNLLPFSSLVCKLFIQIFKWTDVEDWLYGREKPFPQVRQAAYKSLLSWLSIGKSCSLNETQINIIIEFINKDIKFNKKIVSLKLSKKTKNKNSKRGSTVESSEKIEMNVDTCCAALACIPLILRTPISSVVVKNLQEVVVKLLFSIQRMLRCNEELPSPYSNSACRSLLYSSLLALCISPHPHFPPPLHYANVLFNAASMDNDIDVQRVCTNAMNSVAHILRPCAPSFDFQSELDSEVIPINAYPESIEKEMQSLSRRSYQEYLSRKLLEGREIKNLDSVITTNSKTSDSTDDLSNSCSVNSNEKLSTAVEIKKESKVISEKIEKNELIGFGESSDEENIILLNSTRRKNESDIVDDLNKIPSKNVVYSHPKEGSILEKTTNIKTTDIHDGKSKDFQKNKSLKIPTVIDETEEKAGKRQTRSSLSRIVESPIVSNLSETIGGDNSNLSPCKKISEKSTLEVIEVDCQAGSEQASIISKKRNHLPDDEVNSLQTAEVKTRRSTRSGKLLKLDSSNINGNNKNVSKTVDLEIIELDGTRPSRRTRSSKAMTVVEEIDLETLEDSGKLVVDLEKSVSTEEDVSIIEPETVGSNVDSDIIECSAIKPSVIRSKKLSNSPNNSLKTIVEETSISIEDEPQPKRPKSNKSISLEKPSGKITGKDCIDVDLTVCELNDEDEMMNSFVDSVTD